MNKDKVFELAAEAGFNFPDILTTTIEDRLERFAALIEFETVLSMSQRQPETNCHGDGNVYRGVRSKDSSKPTYVCPFIETVKGTKDGQE